ncbi:MAG: fumarate hydratase [Polyangiaceae bacterium]
MNSFVETQFVELIRLAATDLPRDVEAALAKARDAERPMSAARNALDMLLINISKARAGSAPMCQDTGMNVWEVHYPAGPHEKALRRAIENATREATKKTYLRPNSVDSITGKNDGTNVGPGSPNVHFHQWDEPYLKADLLLKGGGCENVSNQMTLPNAAIKAGRDIEGVKRAAIKMVQEAQGLGCSPGVCGIAIGGDRASGAYAAKQQIFRLLDDENPDEVLAKLEREVFEACNTLQIGPMGFGGKTTVLGVKATALNRLPASFFVSLAYECWSCRRASVEIDVTREKATFTEVTHTGSHYVLPARIAPKGR